MLPIHDLLVAALSRAGSHSYSSEQYPSLVLNLFPLRLYSVPKTPELFGIRHLQNFSGGYTTLVWMVATVVLLLCFALRLHSSAAAHFHNLVAVCLHNLAVAHFHNFVAAQFHNLFAASLHTLFAAVHFQNFLVGAVPAYPGSPPVPLSLS